MSDKAEMIAGLLDEHGETMLASMYRNRARIEKEKEDFIKFDKPIFDEIRRRSEARAGI